MATKFGVGDWVAWEMLDGHTMAGTVRDRLCGRLQVRRVDGGLCSPPEDHCRTATPEDISTAIQFYSNRRTIR